MVIVMHQAAATTFFGGGSRERRGLEETKDHVIIMTLPEVRNYPPGYVDTRIECTF
jgi:hypothetical protein